VSDNQIDATPITAADLKTYPYEEGDNLVLGPGVIATKDRAVINWDGVNYVPQNPFELHPPLKAYKVGEYVQVLVSGDWHDGKLAGSERGSSMLHVETEVGPVTVMAPLRIRKAAS
jgi:hypothetical protein